MSYAAELINAVASVATLFVLIFGGIRLYYVLYEHPPHTHEELGGKTPLTTDGIRYPRGTKSNRPRS